MFMLCVGIVSPTRKLSFLLLKTKMVAVVMVKFLSGWLRMEREMESCNKRAKSLGSFVAIGLLFAIKAGIDPRLAVREPNEEGPLRIARLVLWQAKILRLPL